MRLEECWTRHGCDKGSHGYHTVYEKLPEPQRLLEVGVFRGASIAAWLEYYPNAEIHCVDTFQRIAPEQIPALRFSRVHWTHGDSRSVDLDGKFDLIIDDGCHRADFQLDTFHNLFPLLNLGGVYYIEDVWPGKPGYDKLVAALPSSAIHHDLRNGRKVDSYLIEIRC
jgi:predicted O-methyltransferase YrrM